RRRQRTQQHQIAYCEAATRLKHSMHLAEYGGLLGAQVDDTVADHQVHGTGLHRQLFDCAFAEFHIGGPELSCILTGKCQHVVGNVHANNAAAGTHFSPGEESVEPGAAAQIEYRHTWLYACESQRIAATQTEVGTLAQPELILGVADHVAYIARCAATTAWRRFE